MSRKPIKLHCLLCGKPTGTELKVGDIKIPGEDLAEDYLSGVCEECAGHLKDGGVFFADKDDRVLKVSLEASKTKIAESFRGKVIKVPSGAFEELLLVWKQGQGQG